MSRKAVDVSLTSLHDMTDKAIMDLLVMARFGDWSTVRCPHCGSICKHYWRPLQRRWQCRPCRSTFSITSGTVFAYRKISLKKLLSGILTWVNSAAGQPALELKRHMDTSYNTTFVWQAKLRESLVRGYNVGLLNGDIEMDGAHQSGYRAAERRGKPQGHYSREKMTTKQLDTALMTGGAKQKNLLERKREKKSAGVEHVNSHDKDRRILMTVRKRAGQRGRGAVSTRVAIGLAEDSVVANAILRQFVAIPESSLNTDSWPAYTELGKDFLEHRTVEHAQRLTGKNGENNNQAEELNWRYDRAEKGIYLNVEPKYMLDYATEIAFRSDTRRLSNGKQLRLILNVAGSVGLSEFWRGFTHGHHRTVELTHPLPGPAPASGPLKRSSSSKSSTKVPH
jgi:transposase-like protein